MKLCGLFLNTSSASCSIHESGLMAFGSLKTSDLYSLDYMEVSRGNRSISTNYDFYIFNYHNATSMSWLDTRCVRLLPGFKTTLVLEVSPNDPFSRVSPLDFDAYLVLDPTITRSDYGIHAFPRPLETCPDLPEYKDSGVPVVGVFGLPTRGKGFDKLVEAVDREFNSAVIRMNIPMGDYTSTQQLENIRATIETCRKLAKPGVELVLSHDFLSKTELIRWCASNTLNCFLYDRSMPGLAAATDQAISSGRPLAVSANETFRHIHPYLKPYPLRSLRDSIACSQSAVVRMRDAWSPQAFAARMEQVLEGHRPAGQSRPGSFKLRARVLPTSGPLAPLRQMVKTDFLPPLLPKALHYIRNKLSRAPVSGTAPLPPYTSPLISSFSQCGEDLLLDFFLQRKAQGIYVDVGANHPSFNSNTRRFYLRGWSGINIEPTQQGYEAFVAARPRDVNLHMAVGKDSGSRPLYLLSGDTTLSTLDRKRAAQMAEKTGLKIVEKAIPCLPLGTVFEQHLGKRPIDFLSIDTEGTGLEILESNDWTAFRPRFVIIELDFNPDPIKEFMNSANYMLLINNETNGIFVDLLSNGEDLNALFQDFPASSEISRAAIDRKP